jgi:hypothetical protein
MAAGGTSSAIRKDRTQPLMHVKDATVMPCASLMGTNLRFRSSKMMDVIMLAIGLGFFVLSVGYCYACDRL